MIQLQKCLFLNVYLFLVWVVVVGFFLYVKLDLLGHLTRYLSLTVYTLLVVIEFARLYLGNYGNLSCRVPELAGFITLSDLVNTIVWFLRYTPEPVHCNDCVITKYELRKMVAYEDSRLKALD